MNLFEKIVYALSAKMQTPTLYGWFHILFVLLIIGLTTFLCIKFRNCSNKTFKRIIVIAWVIMVLFELYKQINFSFSYVPETNSVIWDYQWYAFPYQLCSAPLYVLPFIAFCKNGKVKDACIAYSSTFVLFGGLVTIIFPANVFTQTIGINIQTMVHHGLQIAFGVFIFVHERKRFNLKFFLKSFYVFGISLVLALALNLIMHTATEETFNMFYISPYFPCILPLLDMIYANVNYFLFLVIYIFGFMLVALIMFYIQYGFYGLIKKRAVKREKVFDKENKSESIDSKDNAVVVSFGTFHKNHVKVRRKNDKKN